MNPKARPRFPIFIPTKGRADIATTPRVFDRIGVDYRLIVEPQEYDAYAEQFGTDRLLTLEERFRDEYETCDDEGRSRPLGSGPARNQAWATALAEGAPWHWVIDDNITCFARLHRNQRIPVGDGSTLHAMETFVRRYRNVGMAGPHYWMFAMSRAQHPPFQVGTRVYSCNLIRTDLPFRWRGRYNEDTILSLDMLKAAWNTVLFYTFIVWKMPTLTMRGGNTDELYEHGARKREKAELLVRAYPDVARAAWRFGRPHHYVDYRSFKSLPLIKDPEWSIERERAEIGGEYDWTMRRRGEAGQRIWKPPVTT